MQGVHQAQSFRPMGWLGNEMPGLGMFFQKQFFGRILGDRGKAKFFICWSTSSAWWQFWIVDSEWVSSFSLPSRFKNRFQGRYVLFSFFELYIFYFDNTLRSGNKFLPILKLRMPHQPSLPISQSLRESKMCRSMWRDRLHILLERKLVQDKKPRTDLYK